MKPAIVYVTCSENGLYCLKHLHRIGWPIECVITISPLLGERYLVSGYVNVVPWCTKFSIPVRLVDDYVIKPENIDGLMANILLVNGWNRLITGEVISMFSLGALGVHAGHPPIGLGRAPLPWNIIKGFKDIEVYVFCLTHRADDGNIMALQVIEITSQDTVATLYEKVMYQATVLFEQGLHALVNGEVGWTQNKQFEIHYPKRTPEDGLINFSASSEEVIDMIRAQTHPYPGAFSYISGEKWFIWSAQKFDNQAFRNLPRVPGRIVLALPSGLIVQTGTETVWITSATARGNTSIPAPLAELELYVGQSFANS